MLFWRDEGLPVLGELALYMAVTAVAITGCSLGERLQEFFLWISFCFFEGSGLKIGLLFVGLFVGCSTDKP